MVQGLNIKLLSQKLAGFIKIKGVIQFIRMSVGFDILEDLEITNYYKELFVDINSLKPSNILIKK